MTATSPAPNPALSLAAGVTGAAFGFASFASAFWANIYKDGHPDAGAVEIVIGLFPWYAVVLPGLLVASIAIRRHDDGARAIFGVAAAILQAAFYYPLVGWFVVLTAVRSVQRRRFSGARMDAVAILAGLTITAVAVVGEAARSY
jgi:hypothetical protein